MSSGNSSYQPVNCAVHDQYERLVITAKACEIAWFDGEKKWAEHQVRLLDVYTKDKAEYIRLRNSQGEDFVVRLDQVIHIFQDGVQVV